MIQIENLNLLRMKDQTENAFCDEFGDDCVFTWHELRYPISFMNFLRWLSGRSLHVCLSVTVRGSGIDAIKPTHAQGDVSIEQLHIGIIDDEMRVFNNNAWIVDSRQTDDE